MCLKIYPNDVAKIYTIHLPQFPSDQEQEKQLLSGTLGTQISSLRNIAGRLKASN